jgi:LEA14-like dessication related protein
LNVPPRWVLVTVAAVCLSAAAGCAYFGKVLDDPELQVTGLENVRIAPDQVRLTAKLSVVNPTHVSLVFKRAAYQLRSGGALLAAGQVRDLPLVPALSRKVLDLPLGVSRTAWPAVPAGGRVAVTFSGTCSLADPWTRAALPFSYRGSVFLFQPPEASVRGGSLTASGLRLYCRLQNPNDQALALNSLAGRLEAAGRTWVLPAVPGRSLPPRAGQDLELDLGPAPELLAELKAGRSAPYRVSGELAFTTPQGQVFGVMRAEGRAEKDWVASP